MLSVSFLPWLSGTYTLHLEDDIGIASDRLLDVRIWPDPAPTVHLQRPAASLDSLALLPDADVTVQLLIEDQQFAVRSVFLEVRAGKDEPAQKIGLYDHRTAGATLPPLLSAFSRVPVPLTGPALRLRPQQLTIAPRLSLRTIKHANGRPLQEGDAIILAACADDFDNVTLDKKSGRSHEVELRIIGRPALDAALNQAQAQLQQDLLKLREQQREAQKKVAEAQKQWRNTGKLRPEDVENLLQAEQLQQQIRGRVGNRQEGLRSEVGRILQTLRDNHLPRSGTQERMDMVADELDRLAREELEQIEPLLTNARKEDELATKPTKPDKNQRGTLDKAREHQDEVEKTLSDLLARLEPWSTTREVKGEARAILDEQRKLAAQTDKLGKEIPAGRDPDAAMPDAGVTPEQKADLDKTADGQLRLGEHTEQLIGKMQRVADEKKKLAEEKQREADQKEMLAEEKRKEADTLRPDDPAKAQRLQEEARTLQKEAEQLKEEKELLESEADALKKAASGASEKDLSGQMKQASRDITKNRLGTARQKQQEGMETLEQLVKALEERREEELDQLIKKLRDAEKEMARLVEEQERLQKKVKEAQKIEDKDKREAELQRLGREQEKLRKKAQDMARQLTRLRGDRAREALSRAAGEMEQAGQQMERGGDPDDPQEEALDRLDDAQREIQRAREDAEEELAREKLAKVADLLKRLKERQEEMSPEGARILREVLEKKEWSRGLLTSLKDHSRAQQGLAEETRSLAEGKLKETLVFARILTRAADAMDQAAESIQKRFDRVRDNPDAALDSAAEEVATKETQELQRLALQRLEQLLDALKPDQGGQARRPQRQQGPPGMGGEGDGLPTIAQLKALKAMQEEINQRTETFNKKHPDASKLEPEEKKTLDGLRQEQAEVADLLQKLTPPADQGGQP